MSYFRNFLMKLAVHLKSMLLGFSVYVLLLLLLLFGGECGAFCLVGFICLLHYTVYVEKNLLTHEILLFL